MISFLRYAFFFFSLPFIKIVGAPLVIGICGGSGSGKTFLAHQIQDHLGTDHVALLHQDNYYFSVDSAIDSINFDTPSQIDFALLRKHIEQLKQGNPIYQPYYDFITLQRSPGTKETLPQDVVVVEGFLLFSVPEIRDILDLKVFLQTDEDIQFIRQFERDTVSRGKTSLQVIQDYLRSVKPGYAQFVKQGIQYADLIIPTNEFNPLALNFFISSIKSYLEQMR